MKKAHDIEMRTIKKTARKAQLEFFKQKSEHVMRIFTQEQMFMVEEYFYLKQRAAKKEVAYDRISRLAQQQESMIQDLTCFVHDCLDQIFLKVKQKQPQILQSMRLAGTKLQNNNDPFRLYQGYMDIVKPLDYETDLVIYKKQIKNLEAQIANTEAKSDAIQSACEQYLNEEKELKDRLKFLEDQLGVEKINRQNDVYKLELEIAKW